MTASLEPPIDPAPVSEVAARLMAEANRILASSLDSEATLEQIARLALPCLGDYCVIDLVDGGRIRRVAAAHVDPERERELRRSPGLALDPGMEGHPVVRALRTGRPQVIPEVSPEEAAELGPADPACALRPRSVMVLPLRGGGRTLGAIMLVLSESGRRYEAPPDGELPPCPAALQQAEIAQALAQQASVAMQLSALAEQGRRAAVLEERNRMAREIHDTLAQGFAGIVVQLEAAEDALSQSPPAAREHLSRARELARESLAEARRSVRALRPQALEQSDLPAALAGIVERLTAATGTRVAFRRSGEPRPVPAPAADHLVRVAQEALANALKHARAGEIGVRLLYRENGLRLEVRDDGHGFDPALAEALGGGIGLASMRERLEGLGGRLTIESAEGAGTTIRADVPLPAAGGVP